MRTASLRLFDSCAILTQLILASQLAVSRPTAYVTKPNERSFDDLGIEAFKNIHIYIHIYLYFRNSTFCLVAHQRQLTYLPLAELTQLHGFTFKAARGDVNKSFRLADEDLRISSSSFITLHHVFFKNIYIYFKSSYFVTRLLQRSTQQRLTFTILAL